MSDLYSIPELLRTFTQKCLDKFRYLATYGFELTSIEEDRYGTEITYKNETTGIRVSYEIRENDIFLYLIRLVKGEIPAYIDAPSRWFYLDNLVKLRSPSTTLPQKEPEDWLTPDDIDEILTAYANALKEYGEDVLRGDFSVFVELAQRIDRPKSSYSIDEVPLITSIEEQRAQLERQFAQTVEYYDTYFFELRNQLRSPDLFSEAIPEYLKGYKRVVSMTGGDGIVVVHYPIEQEITFAETGSGNILTRFPSVPDAKEDSYEAIQFPTNLLVRDLVKLVSGGEDIGFEISPGEMVWGVRGFNKPQQKVDTTTGEITWQAPWTRLVAADVYHLRYWENTERAKREARADIEPYLPDSEPHIEGSLTYEERDETGAPEDLPEIAYTLGSSEEPHVEFGRTLDLVPERNRENERLSVPVAHYVQ